MPNAPLPYMPHIPAYQPRVAGSAPVLQAPVANNSFVLGPFAKLAQLRQPIVEFKTRLHVNANIKPVEYNLVFVAQNPKSLAQLRTRKRTPMTSTGAKGKPVSATMALNTGPTY